MVNSLTDIVKKTLLGVGLASGFTSGVSTIQAQNTPPEVGPDVFGFIEAKEDMYLPVSALDAEDGTNLTYTITPPTHGTLKPVPGSDNIYVYNTGTNYFGDDSFSYTATDSQGASSTQEYSLYIFPKENLVEIAKMLDGRLDVSTYAKSGKDIDLEISFGLGQNWFVAAHKTTTGPELYERVSFPINNSGFDMLLFRTAEYDQ